MAHERRLISTTVVPSGEARIVAGWRRELAVFNVGGTFYTLANSCPHVGAPLAHGAIEGQTVTCPWHAWRFDVTTGKCSTQSRHAESYPTRVEEGWVVVELPD